MKKSQDVVNNILKKFARHKNDTGSSEVQISFLTQEINALNQHILNHKKDYHSYRGLMKKIGHRRNLLTYLRRKDIVRYQEVIKNLGLRR